MEAVCLWPWELGEDAAIDQREWAACAGKASIPKGVKGVVVGCDFGWKWDCTAIVPTWLKDGVAVIKRPRWWPKGSSDTPTTPS